jgi:hypothetical protein
MRGMPWGVLLWFGWAFFLLAGNGLLLDRIINFVDFSERAPFSLLGIFMMAELAFVLFTVTTAIQRKRVAHRGALVVAALPAPTLGGLPPVLLEMPLAAASGWTVLFVPIGLALTVVLIIGLLRPAARAWFTED